jgi:hypothetical protein
MILMTGATGNIGSALIRNVFSLKWRLQRDGGEILSRGLMVGDLTDTGAID